MSGSGDRRGGGPPGPDDGWETMGKKKKQGQVGGRQWAPRSSTNGTPSTARPPWGGNGSSHPSGMSCAQASDRGPANRGNTRLPPQTLRPVVTPPLANGWQWQSRPRPSGSEVEKDDAPPSGSDPENVDGNISDDDDDLSDDISDDYDSDASEKSFESRKTNKWFKEFFEELNALSVEQINEQARQWHCPACKNGPGAIDWYKGLQPLMTHARTKGSTRVRLHRELAALLEEELSRRGTSVVPAGKQFGKWKGLRESTDREIVWPPMVIVMNTFLEKDDDDKWKGMGNQELLDYFGEYAATKARHAYGPSGHRGMSVLIFESSAVGYMEAERLHRHFVNQGTDRNAWQLRKVRFGPGGNRQLFGFLASKEDMEAFNKHCHGKSRLKYEMKSYNEMVVMQMKQMSVDNQQLNYLKNKVVKTEQRSKAVEESLGVVTQKLRETTEENIFIRSKAKEKHLEYEQEILSFGGLHGSGLLAPQVMPLELLRDITNDFSEEQRLGSGTFGTVYKGDLDGKEVAVKLLHSMSQRLDYEKDFMKEFENLSRLNHANIVQLLGYCYEIKRICVEYEGKYVLADKIDRALCFDYMHNGSLQWHLYDESRGLDWQTRYKIIKGTCEGLKYLHKGLEKPMFHLDLKPSNILLDKNMAPKLADFGLSKLVSDNQTQATSSFLGTIGYCPPEHIECYCFSDKFDIFSLGVIMIEIITGPKGSKAVEMGSQGFIDHVQENWIKRIHQATADCTSPKCECLQVKRCVEIALECVHPERMQRPDIEDIISKLNETENNTEKSALTSSSQNET